MDNFDKNQVDKELLEKVDAVLNGESAEEAPELVFSEEIPKDYDISAELNDPEVTAETISEINAAGNAGFKPEVEIPDAEFNYEAPAAPDFGEFAHDGESSDSAWNGQMPQTETWNDLKAKRNPANTNKPFLENNTQAIIGFVIGLIAVLLSLTGYALGLFPIILGIIFSNSGRKGSKKKLAIAGLVMNIIGAALWVFAVIRGLPI